MGRLIVIEGLDGSGKATQAELLYQNLLEKGEKVVKVSFPDYESESSALVKMYLSGQFSQNASGVNPYAASSFYAVDRFASFKCKWENLYNQDYTIIADRYTTSNGVHQCSKLPSEDWKEFLDWLYDFEYVKIGIPKPDLVIYLDMKPEVSQKLISSRYNGDELKKDIHESDILYLKKSRESAFFSIEYDRWEMVSCDDGNVPLSIKDISKKIVDLVEMNVRV